MHPLAGINFGNYGTNPKFAQIIGISLADCIVQDCSSAEHVSRVQHLQETRVVWPILDPEWILGFKGMDDSLTTQGGVTKGIC